MLKKVIFYLNNPGFIVYRWKSFFKNDIKSIKFKDDFDWDLYTLHYKAELAKMKLENLSVIKKMIILFIIISWFAILKTD